MYNAIEVGMGIVLVLGILYYYFPVCDFCGV